VTSVSYYLAGGATAGVAFHLRRHPVRVSHAEMTDEDHVLK